MPEQILKAKANYMKTVPRMLMFSAPVITLSAAKHASITSRGVPYDKEENVKVWFIDGCTRFAGTIQKWTAAALQPLGQP